MPRGLRALSSRGAILKNWFAHTPVCAPSRAEILTGKFFHNLADIPSAKVDVWDRRGNSFGPCFAPRPGRACDPPSSAPGRNMHLNFSLLSPGPTFAQHLSRAGYKSVGVFGKYLNRLPMQPNGQPQIPAGVSTWFVSPGDEANKSSIRDSSGEYFPSFYYWNDGVWNNSQLEYETAFLGNRSMEWLREASARDSPFFLYLAPHSPHGFAMPGRPSCRSQRYAHAELDTHMQTQIRTNRRQNKENPHMHACPHSPLVHIVVNQRHRPATAILELLGRRPPLAHRAAATAI